MGVFVCSSHRTFLRSCAGFEIPTGALACCPHDSPHLLSRPSNWCSLVTYAVPKPQPTKQTVNTIAKLYPEGVLLHFVQEPPPFPPANATLLLLLCSLQDFVDAFEKLLRLGLKHQQEREIVHVLLDTCCQEKQYNPFYSYLLQKFCEYHRRFQVQYFRPRLPLRRGCHGHRH